MTGQIQLMRAEGSELEFSRVFRAPRELIWTAYTTSEHVARWWGPRGCIADPCTVDFRVGGTWHYCLRFGEGEESWGRAVYQEIVQHERIVYSENRSDAAANAYPPAIVISLNFTDVAEGTLLSAHGAFESADALQSTLEMGLLEGTDSTLDRLEEYAAGMAVVS